MILEGLGDFLPNFLNEILKSRPSLINYTNLKNTEPELQFIKNKFIINRYMNFEIIKDYTMSY
jgi:hypothetical protein